LVDRNYTFKGKETPSQAWTGLQGSRRLSLPEFLDGRPTKLVKFSALCTGILYPKEIFIGLVSIGG